VRDSLERESKQFKVTHVGSKEEFEESLTQNKFDVVLTDLNILGYQGLQVLETVRINNPHIPVVILTGTGSLEVAVEAMKKGAADFVIKSPPHIRRLAQTILSVLDEYRISLERNQAQLELEKSEESYRNLANSISDLFFALDKDLRYTYWNRASEKLTNIPPEQAIGKSLYQIFPDIAGTETDNLYNYVLKTKKPRNFVTDYGIKGIKHYFDINVYPSNRGISVFGKDITEKQMALDSLRRSEEQYRTLFDLNPGYTILLGVDGVLKGVNDAAVKITGLSRQELINQHFSDLEIFPEEDIPLHQKEFPKLFNGEPLIYESRIIDKDGAIRLVENHLIPISYQNEIKHILLIAMDITQRKIAEENIKASLREKEVLIQEIHHRVKNNMQIISSLINLQANRLDDVETKTALKESQNRIKSMALVHEKLYQSEDLSHINFADYVKSMVRGLFYSYNVEEQVKVLLDVDEVQLNIETAVPCGLIISELVSNSLKYAFPTGIGEIQISLRKQEDEYELIIGDDGVGFPEELDYQKTESLGLQLVNTLVNQVDGVIELDRSNGTEFKIRFKELLYKERI
jgi:PAS domain S-box-containing protein